MLRPLSESPLKMGCAARKNNLAGRRRTHGSQPYMRASTFVWALLAGATLVGATACSDFKMNTPNAVVFVTTPGSVAFGNVNVGQAATLNLVLRNETLSTVEISQLDVSGQPFSVGGPGKLPVSVNSGATLALTVQFKPMSPGAASGQLSVISNATSDPTTSIDLSGEGVLVTPPVSGLTCTSSTFTGAGTDSCTVELGAAAPTGGFTVALSSNDSSVSVPASVTVSADSSSATFPAAISAVNTAQSATLTAAAGSTSKTFALNLTPAAATAAPALSALTCASTSITGAATDTCTITLSSSGPSAVTVNLSSNNAAVAVPPSVTVSANATSVAFIATASAVSSNETATLTAKAGGATANLTLQLNAVTQLLGINATSIAFGDVLLNSPSTQSVTLTSTGILPVTVSSITLAGAGFTLSSASFPATLSSGQSSTFNVEFDPTVTGTAQGTLVVVSTSTVPVKAVALSGTGVNFAVGLNWDAPSESDDPAVSYNVYRTAGSSSSYQRLNSTSAAQTTYSDSNVQSGSTYQYYVTSVDDSGTESVPSNTATITVP